MEKNSKPSRQATEAPKLTNDGSYEKRCFEAVWHKNHLPDLLWKMGESNISGIKENGDSGGRKLRWWEVINHDTEWMEGLHRLHEAECFHHKGPLFPTFHQPNVRKVGWTNALLLPGWLFRLLADPSCTWTSIEDHLHMPLWHLCLQENAFWTL